MNPARIVLLKILFFIHSPKFLPLKTRCVFLLNPIISPPDSQPLAGVRIPYARIIRHPVEKKKEEAIIKKNSK
jgi:hypothetical protein